MIAILVHGLLVAFRVGRVERVPLPRQDHLLLVLDLVGVVVADGACDSHALVVEVEHKVVLTHHRTTQDHIVTVLYIDGDAIATCFLTVEILRRVPVKYVVLFFCTKIKAQDRERAEIVVRAVRKLVFVVAETEIALAMEIHPTLAVIFWVERAEPIKVNLDRLIVSLIHISERCT